MRIRLRLSLQDMDLIAIKHNKNLNYADFIREALQAYVQTGAFARITVPDFTDYHIHMKPEVMDFSLSPQKHKDVIYWVLGIQSGLRNRAIKTVLRCSIVNPPMWVFKSDADITYEEKPLSKAAGSTQGITSATKEKQQFNSEDVSSFEGEAGYSGFIQERVVINDDGEEELDLLDFDFENY